MSSFEKRAHFAQKMIFKLVVLRKSTLNDLLPVALCSASLAASVTEIHVLKVQECAENNFEKMR